MVILYLIWMDSDDVHPYHVNFVNNNYPPRRPYAPLSLQISTIWGIKNEGLEEVQTPSNPSLSFFKKLSNKIIELFSLSLLYPLLFFFFNSKQSIKKVRKFQCFLWRLRQAVKILHICTLQCENHILSLRDEAASPTLFFPNLNKNKKWLQTKPPNSL